MQLFNVTLHQNSKFGSLQLGLTFQIDNPRAAEGPERLICSIYTKTILQDLCSTVTVNKCTIKDHKSYCCFGKIFIFGNG